MVVLKTPNCALTVLLSFVWPRSVISHRVHIVYKMIIEQEILGIKQALAEIGSRVSRLEGRTISPPRSNLAEVPTLGVLSPQTPSVGDASTPDTVSSSAKIESAVTGKWFAVIGIIALIFGVSFFLKFAFENNLIGVTGRVMLGLGAGLVLLVVGDYLARRESYRAYSFYLTGGGLALLYLSIYAAFNFYQLISQYGAFGFMILVR